MNLDLYILDVVGNPIIVIDSYKSLIWTKRYYTCGDFELCLSANTDLLNYLKIDNLIIRDNDDTVMIIEKIEIITDVENGDFFIISGRSLESLLSRRIIWTQTNISTNNPADAVYTLIKQNTLSGTPRNIPRLSIDETFSMNGNLNVQFTGDNLLEAITAICKRFGFGFKMNQNFVFSCYRRGKIDVAFSYEFDNIITSNYSHDYTNYANCALIAGEGEGTARKTIAISNDISGLKRREVYIDARDLSTNNGEISDADYYIKLSQRGEEKLNEFIVATAFDGEIEPQSTYVYKFDYNLGNIVTVENKYGVISSPRIVEIIESWDENGYIVIPTFEELEVE